jgi:putative addiction module component (TIGR02574 family)
MMQEPIDMNTQDMVKQALKLDPAQRFELVEEILHSLDQPDPAIDAVWLEKAERRLAAHRAGKVKGIPAEDIFGKL